MVRDPQRSAFRPHFAVALEVTVNRTGGLNSRRSNRDL